MFYQKIIKKEVYIYQLFTVIEVEKQKNAIENHLIILITWTNFIIHSFKKATTIRMLPLSLLLVFEIFPCNISVIDTMTQV
jgi:hypothetical protein